MRSERDAASPYAFARPSPNSRRRQPRDELVAKLATANLMRKKDKMKENKKNTSPTSRDRRQTREAQEKEVDDNEDQKDKNMHEKINL